MLRGVGIGFVLLTSAGALGAQGKGDKGAPELAGTWQLEKGNVKADGPKIVVIRPDSSASWGKETVRWRLKGDQIMIALGGEWETYKLKLKTDRMMLSGGDLTEQITLKRTGPSTPRPAGVMVPPDPDTQS
ncbi:MAG: hypothetical protein ABI647_03685 [Gemmatimonadota bacterium]